ncbi:MAG: hypothetical protein J5836_02755 [Clostridia bacterium]|nr:hypothetical protein [Clostridia bacterium]
MKLKDFLKSSAFKCILVLLSIALASGGLLSILNDLLAVSPAEQKQRVITKYYPDPSVSAEEKELTEDEKTNEFGVIETVYLVSDGNLIINAAGYKGYKNENVKAWVIIDMVEGKFAGVQSVVADSSANGKQSLLGNLSDGFFKNYSAHNEELKSGEYFTLETGEMFSLASGATHTSEGMNNAVNAAVYYAKALSAKGGNA